ncbi:protein-tyrosine phosphatase family protein [Arsenophonus nasoniae]|uniref:Protein-tyrosine phosphatase n=1 Tax=Arsenophonus nasoniae TaxID=638 RepID=D2U188_9GAMM|nr:protein-tyrosine phosphatase family protein [Arsenophonus nasoniae]QBY45241.1 Tyrosine-protein phosphatase YopH [Arsenophonus nasoniae]WGM05422.1 protein-tyrosine phosphatase family protein [Arsenophonus nasoniae]WGM10432.1 protein-tyrosine phosphatase family protein [Arsenophonus nasoniae]WGM15143.1 protein-tyrosine phosphatase family protein [Arsenophonus nasoniae]CBA74446.1 protein-tyrosine phosphatase [Arsenophonus nasoniae]
MPNISPIYSNITPNINYASDEASSGQAGTQKTNYQGRNIVKDSESTSVLLRNKPHLNTETDPDSNKTRRHGGLNFQIDETPPELAPKPTVVKNKLIEPPQLSRQPTLGTKDTLDIPAQNKLRPGEVNTLMSSTSVSTINNDTGNLASKKNDKPLLAKATRVEAPDGKIIPANRVQIGNKNVAMISEYPKAEYLESYFKMLADNQTPILVVLASNKGIAAEGLPEYFKQNGQYGSVSVQVEQNKKDQSVSKFCCDMYQIKITQGNHAYELPVMHINNWLGKNSIDNEGLKTIADCINLASQEHSTELYQKNSQAIYDPNKVLPVIHGNKGYERSAFLVAATEVAKPNNKLSVEEIVSEIKNSTSAKILNQETQLQLLKQFEKVAGNYTREKRSSARMDEDTVKSENTIDTDTLPAKLKRMLSDPEVPAVALPLRTLSVEEQQQAAILAKDLFQRLKDEFSDANIDKSQYIQKIENQRFGNIWTAQETAVTAPNGQLLAANRVQIAGQNVAITCQYPKPASLQDYFKMLVANRTPALVVLASDKDINPEKGVGLPEYFRQDNQYGDVSVTVIDKGEGKLADELDYHDYLLHVTDQSQNIKVTIPVIHVSNWPDLTASGNEGLKELAEHVNVVVDKKINFYKEKGSSAINDENKLLPVMHCRAGVGRTGQLLATMELLKSESQQSLESIVRDMRTTRDGKMVQISAQMQTLAVLAEQLNKPITDNKLQA